MSKQNIICKALKFFIKIFKFILKAINFLLKTSKTLLDKCVAIIKKISYYGLLIVKKIFRL